MEDKKNFCIKCLKEVDCKTEKCECGNRNFAFGKLKVENGKILCECGNNQFEWKAHLDYTNKATTIIKCTKCGNICETEYFRNMSC